MSMNATQESNMQRTGYRTIVGKHALTDQQARVFDTLDPRPDIPWPQFNMGNLTHGAFRQVATIECRCDSPATVQNHIENYAHISSSGPNRPVSNALLSQSMCRRHGVSYCREMPALPARSMNFCTLPVAVFGN